MVTAEQGQEKRTFFYGWTIVGATFVLLMIMSGITYSTPVLFRFFEADFAIGRAQAALLFSVSQVAAFVVGAVTGGLAEKYGRASWSAAACWRWRRPGGRGHGQFVRDAGGLLWGGRRPRQRIGLHPAARPDPALVLQAARLGDRPRHHRRRHRTLTFPSCRPPSPTPSIGACCISALPASAFDRPGGGEFPGGRSQGARSCARRCRRRGGGTGARQAVAASPRRGAARPAVLPDLFRASAPPSCRSWRSSICRSSWSSPAATRCRQRPSLPSSACPAWRRGWAEAPGRTGWPGRHDPRRSGDHAAHLGAVGGQSGARMSSTSSLPCSASPMGSASRCCPPSSPTASATRRSPGSSA